MSQDSNTTPPDEESQRNRIVVGHDGSQGATQALTMALELADKIELSVLLVRAWSIGTAPRPPEAKFGYVPSQREMSESVQASLIADAAPHVASFPHLDVSYRVVWASPSKSLIEISRNAYMLVVGSRGLGGFAGMVLGSVSEQSIRHATCPVLVVRPRG
jgi:nucleotide-binding universal stress UspA family protein